METVGAACAGFLLARTRAAQSGQGSVDEGQELARSAAKQDVGVQVEAGRGSVYALKD